MYRLSKAFAFSASHRLTHLPDGHPCARLHGHNYAVELVVEGEPDRVTGFAAGFDYNDARPFARYLDETLDHRHLNDVLGDGPGTTAENLARHLYRVARDLGLPAAEVSVSETPKTRCTYRP